MSFDIDWAAQIIPGSSMMGLEIGIAQGDVIQALSRHAVGADVVRFKNSPELLIDSSEENVIYLRASEIRHVNYSWQNEVSRLVFRTGKLSSITVETPIGEESLAYRDVLFGRVGLGSPVSNLLEFCDLEYDSAEEWFYPIGNTSGLVVAGRACDLSVDPNQAITFIKVFAERSSGIETVAP